MSADAGCISSPASATRRQCRDIPRRQGAAAQAREVAGPRLLVASGRPRRIRRFLHTALAREVDEEAGLTIDIVALAGWREVLPASGGSGGHYLIMSFAARWVAREPVLNDEHDDFKWLAPDALGDLKVTGGLQEVVNAAKNQLLA